MKLYHTAILLILCGLCMPAMTSDAHADEITLAKEQPQMAWAGPGYYSGSWFDTEEDYNNYWAKNDRHDDKHHRDRDKDHHKDKKKDYHKDKKKHHDKKHRK